MITSCILLIFLGVYFLYHAVQKADLSNEFIVKRWIQINTKLAKILAITCLLLAIFGAILIFGSMVGILFWLIALMTIMSFVVILQPFEKITVTHVFICSLTLYLIEFS